MRNPVIFCVAMSLFASVCLSAEAPATDDAKEKAKIEFLLQTIEGSKITFVRNGTAYDGSKAAAHLRAKWQAAGEKVKTARQFIEVCGTKSSMSGKAYEVSLDDGKTRIPCATWLETTLVAHEQGKADQDPGK